MMNTRFPVLRRTIHPLLPARHPQRVGLYAWWPLGMLAPKADGVGSFLDTGPFAHPGIATTAAANGQWSMEAAARGTAFIKPPEPIYDETLGSVAYFNGTNSTLKTVTASLDVSHFTIAAWVRPHFTNGTGNQATAEIVSHPTADSGASDPWNVYDLATDTSSPAKFRVYISTGLAGSGASVSSVTTITLGAVYHVVATYDQQNLRIYINGIQENSSAQTLAVGAAATFTYIGAFNNQTVFTTNFWKGNIGDVRIYNRALSAAEVYQLYAPQTRWALYRPTAQLFDPLPFQTSPASGGGVGFGAHRFFFGLS